MGRRRSRPASHRRSLSARESADAGNQVGTWSADLIWGVAETYRVPVSIIGTSSERATLRGFSERTGALVGHRIFGDPVSLLGIRSGAVKAYWAARECIDNHKNIDKSHDLNNVPVSALSLVTSSLEPVDAMRAYGLSSGLWMYTWSVHETDSFFYAMG